MESSNKYCCWTDTARCSWCPSGDAKEATLIKTDQATGAVTTYGVVLTAKDTKAQRRLTSFNSASNDERCHESGACLFTYAELMHIHGRDQHGRILVPSQGGPGGPTTNNAGAERTSKTDPTPASVAYAEVLEDGKAAMSGQSAIDKADKFFASAVAPGDNTTIGTDRRYFVKFTYEDLCSAYGLRDCQLAAPSDWGMADVVGCDEP